MPEDPTTAETATTTPTPEAQDAQGTTPDPTAELEALRAKYERAQKDLTKFRTRAEEVEAAQKAAEAERLKAAPLEERLKALEAERDEFAKRATTAELTAQLTGKVIDPQAAIRLWEDGMTVEAFVEKYPFMAPQPTGPTPTRGAGGSTPRDGNLKPEDFRGKSPAWIEKNLDRLKPPTS